MSDRLDEIFAKATRLRNLGAQAAKRTTHEEDDEIVLLFEQGFTWDTWKALEPIMAALAKTKESPADERERRGD